MQMQSLFELGLHQQHGSDPDNYLAEHSYYSNMDYRCDAVMSVLLPIYCILVVCIGFGNLRNSNVI